MVIVVVFFLGAVQNVRYSHVTRYLSELDIEVTTATDRLSGMRLMIWRR